MKYLDEWYTTDELEPSPNTEMHRILAVDSFIALERFPSKPSKDRPEYRKNYAPLRPEEQHELVFAHEKDADGETHRRIGEEVNLSPQGAYFVETRALQKLRQYIRQNKIELDDPREV